MHRPERAESRKEACSSGRHRREHCCNNVAENTAEEEENIPASGIAARNNPLTHVVHRNSGPYLILHNEQALQVSTQKKHKACRSKASSPPSPAAPSSIQSSPPVTSQPTALSSSSAVSQTALAQCPSLIP